MELPGIGALFSVTESVIESVGGDSSALDKIKSMVGLGQEGDSFDSQQASGTQGSPPRMMSAAVEWALDKLQDTKAEQSLKSGYADSTDWNQQYSGAVSTLQSNFDLLDTAAGVGGKDGLIGRDDLQAALENPNLSKEIKDACRFLLENPSAWNQLDVGSGIGKVDGLISRGDLEAETARLAASQAEVGGGENDGSEDYDQSVPPRFESEVDGNSGTEETEEEDVDLEGLTSEETAQVLIEDKLSSLEEEIQQKLAEMNKTDDASELAQKNYELQNLLEMRKQMFTLMSNLSAVCNEMAKTAISNLGRA